MMRNAQGRLRSWTLVLAFLVGGVLLSLTVPALAKNFVDTTHLTILRTPSGTLSPGERVNIHGRLKSVHQACHSHKKIHLYRRNKGQSTFHHIDVTTTTTTGKYHFFRHPRKSAEYYTRFKGTDTGVHPNHHVCLKSRSRTIHIPVS
jgi:hypothetical protein